MKLTKELAEIAGLFAADGSMQKEHICFWGNPESDKDYYDNHIKSLFIKTFNIEIRPHEKPSNFVYGFYVCNKKVINFFNKNLDFPFGKKTYTVEVPKVIYKSKNKKILAAFLRGFCSGDGSLNFEKKQKEFHYYPRIQIKSVSKEIILQMKKMLEVLEIKNTITIRKSRRINEADSFGIEIKGVERLDKWVKKIGFSNNSQLTRYKIFKKHGFSPSNTTYKERLQILDGKLDPKSFYTGPWLSLDRATESL